MENIEMQAVIDEFDIEYQAAFNEKTDCSLFSITGIYFLLHNSEIVFVGQSVNILVRVGQHWIQKEKEFDSFSFVPCPAESLNLLQAHFICKFMPKYNSGGLPQQDMFKSLSQLKSILGLDLYSVKKIIRLNNIKDYNGFYKMCDFNNL